MRLANSFIPVEGVGERTERRLWRAGVTHWDDFCGATVPGVGPTLADRIGSFIGEATDRLAVGDARFFEAALPTSERWRLVEDFSDRTTYLDIETTGLDPRWADVTVVGLHDAAGTRTLVRGDDLTADAVRRALADTALLVTFNGAQFDVPFLESALGVGFDGSHLDLRYPCKRLGLAGGLKAIERSVGLERDRPDLSGRDAVRLWHAHERGDDGALETLLAYNLEDVVHLEALTRFVCDRLHDEVFEAAVASDAAAVGH